jgi:hypothetical protein
MDRHASMPTGSAICQLNAFVGAVSLVRANHGVVLAVLAETCRSSAVSAGIRVEIRGFPRNAPAVSGARSAAAGYAAVRNSFNHPGRLPPYAKDNAKVHGQTNVQFRLQIASDNMFVQDGGRVVTIAAIASLDRLLARSIREMSVNMRLVSRRLRLLWQTAIPLCRMSVRKFSRADPARATLLK